MGLDTSHGCWQGSYGAFSRWRCEIAKAAGLPPLGFMEGFYPWTNITPDEASAAVKQLGFDPEHRWAVDLIAAFYDGGNMPIKWECLKPSPLHTLLHHSDCDGEIPAELCNGIADALEELLPRLPDGDGGGHIGIWREKTQAFIAGLRIASSRGENVEFY
jgi:hypothetical protein